MRSRLFSLVLACTFVTPTIALAQTGQTESEPERIQLEEKVTVTATRLQEPVRDVGSSVTVVTAEQIRASGARWLLDVLSRVPGLSVARTGGPGAVTRSSPGAPTPTTPWF